MKRERARQRKHHDKEVVASTVMRKKKTRDTDRKMLGLVPPPDPMLCLDEPSNGSESSQTPNPSAVEEATSGDGSVSSQLLAHAPSRSGLDPPRRLLRQRKCWLCKTSYEEVHFFYDQFCPSCADFNFRKRESSADLSGRVALVTGGRVKIGFFIALKLLRCGATVLVQTRFPHDAARRSCLTSSRLCYRVSQSAMARRTVLSRGRLFDVVRPTPHLRG